MRSSAVDSIRRGRCSSTTARRTSTPQPRSASRCITSRLPTGCASTFAQSCRPDRSALNRHSAHFTAIARISAPIFVAQVAVLANAVADTVITGHYKADHLAAIGLGASIWSSVFIPLMGVLQGLSPIVARHYGANDPLAIGRELRGGFWVGVCLAVPMVLLFTFPDPVLHWAKIPAAVLPLSRSYLQWLACGVPALMVARVF